MQNINWNPLTYAQASDIQFWQAMEALTILNLKGDERILDLGCGDGKITALLADKVPKGEVVGIDITPEMIEFSKDKFDAISNLSFELLSADNLSYIEEFDYVVSFSCLHWIKNQKSVWQGIFKALKPGGQVIAGFQSDHEHLWDAIVEVISKSEWKNLFSGFQDPYNHYSLKAMQGYIQSAGFYLARADEIHQVESLKSVGALKNFLQNWVPQFRFLEDDKAALFVDEVIGNYMSKIDPVIRQQAGIRIKRFIFHAIK